jgi:SAM-dependent methyltransferase
VVAANGPSDRAGPDPGGPEAADPRLPELYGPDLALVHHLGFADHADRCAPGILAFLEPARHPDATVVELGCGSGALTRHLVAAGWAVIATDASPAMLELTRRHVPGAAKVERLVLPVDPIPPADAVVSVGHVLNYLPDAGALRRSLEAAATALRPGGRLAIDLCDLGWGARARGAHGAVRVHEDWVVAVRWELPRPDRFVKRITTFLPDGAGSWRRRDEVHENVLVDVRAVSDWLAPLGVDIELRDRFDGDPLPEGLVAVLGTKAGGGAS